MRLTQQGVGVLGKGDGDQPVVDLEVRQDVQNQDLLESSLAGPESDDRKDDQETNVRHDDLRPVLGLEVDGRRLEVCQGEMRQPGHVVSEK